MAFLFIANDVETTPALRMDASSAINSVLNLLSDDRQESHQIEALVAREIWAYASAQAPPCQRSVVKTFGLANRPSVRICRRVAYHLLLETPPSTQPDEYLALPPLQPIIALVSRTHAGPFGITPKTDYYDLEARADVLNKMLIGMSEYVALESSKSSLLSSTEAMENKALTPLQRLTGALQSLSYNIADTRAAHLDRSSAKSWIQMVQLRVHYQREGLLSALSGGRRKGPRKITDMLSAAPSSSKGASAVVSREASAGPSGSGGVNGA
ncbi:hypothetical protein PENSPDRAFT_448796 [Peniophora sp. CONT]|nr:hypothetical protein PENSPDRAFT_448796 [Peniophora sp. CONT]